MKLTDEQLKILRNFGYDMEKFFKMDDLLKQQKIMEIAEDDWYREYDPESFVTRKVKKAEKLIGKALEELEEANSTDGVSVKRESIERLWGIIYDLNGRVERLESKSL